MNPSASIAPVNTVNRGFLIAKMAAMKKVLSPSSDTMITDREAKKAWIKPRSTSTRFFTAGPARAVMPVAPGFAWDAYHNNTKQIVSWGEKITYLITYYHFWRML